MRILHGKPQSAAELLRLRDIIRANCTMLIVALAHFVKDKASVNALLSAGERKCEALITRATTNEMCSTMIYPRQCRFI
ncbi:hypothetical protein TL16_g02984 [Triparma laevis f. inornata]|uniref:Uncharacterized protein n=1 Tax=Triparma laevis f. inornata TaxID=1714386 RepID=A0A9W7A2F7_9STRA|nr:hypothetical protein TL16_g02984 [Triparma laevis f. inornata]